MSIRRDLLGRGIDCVERFCAANGLTVPRVVETTEPVQFGVCAYYRDGHIFIWPNACALPGRQGRQWSWPGHTIDRTPFGVVAHELGHHVDRAHGARPGAHGYWRWRGEASEKPISGYCPNDNEWFAEMFRLFVTNPDLLRVVRPLTFQRMRGTWTPVETRPWREVLQGALRQVALIERRLRESEAKAMQAAARTRKTPGLPMGASS